MRILIAAVMALVMTMAAYAEAPKIIMNGEYVIDAIDITEPPPIDRISDALDEVDAFDDTPYNAQVPLSNDLQRYIWNKCKEATVDYKNLYSFMLGLIDQESEFNPRAVSKTNDYGLTQTNKKYVFPDAKKALGLNDITDCFDPYVSIDCCFFELMQKLESYSVSERLYYWYNTGRTSGSCNANSRAMKKKWQKWESIIWDS